MSENKKKRKKGIRNFYKITWPLRWKMDMKHTKIFFPRGSKSGVFWSRVFPVCKKTVDLSQLSTSFIYCPAYGCYCLLKMCVCQHVWRMYGGNGVWPQIKIRDKGPNPGKETPQSSDRKTF